MYEKRNMGSKGGRTDFYDFNGWMRSSSQLIGSSLESNEIIGDKSGDSGMIPSKITPNFDWLKIRNFNMCRGMFKIKARLNIERVQIIIRGQVSFNILSGKFEKLIGSK